MASISKPKVILASSSRYRAALLTRILQNFEQRASAVDETAQPGESAAKLSLRLAVAKAEAIDSPGTVIVIGSDQVAQCNGKLIGKPGDARANIEQLLSFSNQSVDFYSAVAVRYQNKLQTTLSCSRVKFRTLSPVVVERYVQHERAWDCAGGFKAESAAPVLLESLQSDDPTSIVGLPLNWLAAALSNCGLELPA